MDSLNDRLTAQQTWALNEVRGGIEVEDWQDAVSFASTLKALAATNPELITIEPSSTGRHRFWARATPLAIELLDAREVTPEEEIVEGRNLTHEDRWLLFESDRMDVADVPLDSRLAAKAVDLAQRHPRLLTVQETPRGLEVVITPAGREARHRPRPLHPEQLNVLRDYAWGGTIFRERDGWALSRIADQRPDLVRLTPASKPLTAKATYAGLMDLWHAHMLPEHPDHTLLRKEWEALDKLAMSPMGWLGLVAAGWDTTTEEPPSLSTTPSAFRSRLWALRQLYGTQSAASWVLCGVNVVLMPVGKAVQDEEAAVSLEAHWASMRLDSASMPPWETKERLSLLDKLNVTTDQVARSNICRVLETWTAELSAVAPERTDEALLACEPVLWRTEAEELRHKCGMAMGRFDPAGRWVTWMMLLSYPWAKWAGMPWAQSVAP